MKRLKIILGVVLGMSALLPGRVCGTDIPISPTGPVFKIQPALAWGSGVNAFNNNFFFTPINVNENVCIYVKNNNPTNSHAFSVSISVTPDPSNTTPSDGTWQVAANNQAGSTVAAAPSIASSIGASVSGVAQISVNFTNSSVQAGSPDTANVIITQTTAPCFSGLNSIGSTATATTIIPQIQAFSDSLGESFTAANPAVVNPAINQVILHINANSAARTLYFDRFIVDCTAACTIAIQATNSLGTTCTSNAPVNMKAASPTVSTAVGQSACTVNPGIGATFYIVDLPANTPTIFDLRAAISLQGTVNGVEVNMFAALAAGTVRATAWWAEK